LEIFLMFVDLFWNHISSMCLLTIYVIQLPTTSIYILLTISESAEPSNLLKTAIYYSLTFWTRLMYR
jgi:hypothetical protein